MNRALYSKQLFHCNRSVSGQLLGAAVRLAGACIKDQGAVLRKLCVLVIDHAVFQRDLNFYADLIASRAVDPAEAAEPGVPGS